MYPDEYFEGQIIMELHSKGGASFWKVTYVRDESDFDGRFTRSHLENGDRYLNLIELGSGDELWYEDASESDIDVTDNELIRILYGENI